MAPPRIDMAGERFGRLRVMDMAGMNRHGHRLWACRCDCGGSVEVAGNELRRADGTRSCGCLRREWGAQLRAATKTN